MYSRLALALAVDVVNIPGVGGLKHILAFGQPQPQVGIVVALTGHDKAAVGIAVDRRAFVPARFIAVVGRPAQGYGLDARQRGAAAAVNDDKLAPLLLRVLQQPQLADRKGEGEGVGLGIKLLVSRQQQQVAAGLERPEGQFGVVGAKIAGIGQCGLPRLQGLETCVVGHQLVVAHVFGTAVVIDNAGVDLVEVAVIDQKKSLAAGQIHPLNLPVEAALADVGCQYGRLRRQQRMLLIAFEPAADFFGFRPGKSVFVGFFALPVVAMPLRVLPARDGQLYSRLRPGVAPAGEQLVQRRPQAGRRISRKEMLTDKGQSAEVEVGQGRRLGGRLLQPPAQPFLVYEQRPVHKRTTVVRRKGIVGKHLRGRKSLRLVEAESMHRLGEVSTGILKMANGPLQQQVVERRAQRLQVVACLQHGFQLFYWQLAAAQILQAGEVKTCAATDEVGLRPLIHRCRRPAGQGRALPDLPAVLLEVVVVSLCQHRLQQRLQGVVGRCQLRFRKAYGREQAVARQLVVVATPVQEGPKRLHRLTVGLREAIELQALVTCLAVQPLVAEAVDDFPFLRVLLVHAGDL